MFWISDTFTSGSDPGSGSGYGPGSGYGSGFDLGSGSGSDSASGPGLGSISGPGSGSGSGSGPALGPGPTRSSNIPILNIFKQEEVNLLMILNCGSKLIQTENNDIISEF